MLFSGRNRVRYPYSRFGYTRGGGKTWHGGLDIEGMDSEVIRMPWFWQDGRPKDIRGTVTRARIVTDHSNRTWEWGYYICVRLDAGQTPDAVNYLYFCHNAENLVAAGQTVCSGEALARMGNTGNAALADPPFAHCHLEARATATGRGLNPAAYAGLPNAVGIYTQAPGPAAMQRLTMENLPNADAWEIFTLCEARGLVAAGLYSARYLDAAATRQTVTVGPVSEEDAQAIFRLACARGLNDGRYKAAWVQGEE